MVQILQRGPTFADSLSEALSELGSVMQQRRQQQQQSQLLSQLLNPNLNSSQILQAGLKGGIPQSQLLPLLKQAQGQEKQRFMQDLAERKEQRQDYAEVLREEGKYNEDIKAAYKTIPKMEKALERILKNAEAAGPINSVTPKPLLSNEARLLENDINTLINVASENMKGRLTNARLSFLAGEKPEISMRPEALKFVANKWKEDLQELKEEYNIAQDVKKQNKGRVPRNYQNIVANELGLRRGNNEDQEFRSPDEPKQQALQQAQEGRVGKQVPNPTIPQQSPPSEGEGYLGQAARLLTGAGVGALGGAAEVPSALAGLGDVIYKLGAPSTHISDQESKRQALQREAQTEAQPFERLQEVLPTAESVKERAKQYLPEGYLEPKNEAEKFVYDVAEDVGTLLFPLGPTAGASKALKVAGLGNAAKYLTKYVGGSEKAQEGAKLGTMLLTSFGLQPSVRSRINAYYDSLSSSPAIEKPIITKGINEVITDIERTFSGIGASNAPSKKLVNEVIKDWKKVSPGNQSVIRDVWEFKKDLSDRYAQATAKELRRAKPALNKIQESLNKALKTNTEVPSFIKDNLSQADQLNAGLANSKRAQDFVHKYMGKIGAKGARYGIVPAIQALVISPAKTLGSAAVGLGGAALASGGARVAGAIKELLTNPAFAKAYAEFANAALKESASGVVKSVNKMNKIAKKDQGQ